MRKISSYLLVFIIATVSFQFLAVSHVLGSGGCDTDCVKCHSISTEEVKLILAKLNNPDAKILKVQMSPSRGLWEVAIENKGQGGLFYVDFAKKYVISGTIIEVDGAINRTKERVDELNKNRKISPSRIPLKDAFILGDSKAPKKVIVFTDPECPFCGKYHTEIKKVVAQRKDITFYIKLFPLTKLHPDAYWKSQSIICNRSLKLLEDNFEKQPIPKTECGTKEIDENIKLAASLGITGTPTSIMPDGSVKTGFLEADKIIKIIDAIKTKGKSR
ncbi:MAG: DsbC family protein [Nitrospirae bacterium]|nr:DsbC family protein [Nitrospirota bacterium]